MTSRKKARGDNTEILSEGDARKLRRGSMAADSDKLAVIDS